MPGQTEKLREGNSPLSARHLGGLKSAGDELVVLGLTVEDPATRAGHRNDDVRAPDVDRHMRPSKPIEDHGGLGKSYINSMTERR
jgi:hypothetical protein